MTRKVLICGLVIITLAGLSFSIQRSNYARALEEATSRNTAMKKNDSALVIDATGSPPGWTEEVLMGLFANRNELTIRVESGGCTKKKDFWIWCHYDEKSKNGPPHYILTIYRTRKDQCKAFHPTGVLIKFNLRKELGLPYLFTYSVTNRVGAGLMPGK